MVSVMLEPVGATATWKEDLKEAVFPTVVGQFQRVSFALDGIVVAIDMGYVMATSVPTVVKVDDPFIELLQQPRKWYVFT